MAQDQSELNGGYINPSFGLRLVKKGADSMVYNADGSLIKVIASPTEYITYQKAGNTLTATHYLMNASNGKVECTPDGAAGPLKQNILTFPITEGAHQPTFMSMMPMGLSQKGTPKTILYKGQCTTGN